MISKDTKFDIDKDDLVYEFGSIWPITTEPNQGHGIYNEFHDSKGNIYRIWELNEDDYRLVNLTTGEMSDRFITDQDVIDYYLNPSTP